MTRPYSFLQLLTLFCLLYLGDADDGTEDSLSDDETLETLLMAVYSTIFSICISLIAVVTGYFSFLEDMLMSRYSREGAAILAKVVSIEYARQWNSNSTEFVATIEYTDVSQGKLVTSVHKQVMATDEELLWSNVPASIKLQPGNSQLPKTDSMPSLSLLEGAPQQIKLLILPGFPKSAIPRSAVCRATSWKYRLPTITLVLFLFSFSYLMMYFGHRKTPNFQYNYFLIAFASIQAVEIIITHFFLRTIFDDVLLKEYLNGGEFAVIKGDDTTLSTKESGFNRGELIMTLSNMTLSTKGSGASWRLK